MSFAAVDSWAKDLVDSNHLANTDITIYRKGMIAYESHYGYADLQGQRPLKENMIFRIYSMTKPVVSAAVLMLIEDEKLNISDPVSKFIPEFANPQVVKFENGQDIGRVAARSPVTVHHLMTQTAGMTYGGEANPPVSTSYRKHGVDFSLAYAQLDELAAIAGTQPLYAQPGTQWIYSIASDILGRVIEVASGLSLDQFLEKRIFTPLQMTDTAFHVPQEKQSRFVSNFGYDRAGNLEDRSSGSDDRFLRNGTLLSGGSGLVSTSRDYLEFTKMLLGRGTCGNIQVLKPSSIDQMTRNQLPGDLPSMGCAVHGNMDMAGIGYGYGVSVTVDKSRASVACSNGDYGWAGVANTYFWVDPAEKMIVLFLSQLMPATDMPIRADLRRLVYDKIGV